jgi:hypothetical protein
LTRSDIVLGVTSRTGLMDRLECGPGRGFKIHFVKCFG